MNKVNVDILHMLYSVFDVPRDTLIGTPVLLKKFTEEYNKLTNGGISIVEMSSFLFCEGKKGESKGGLPRIRRRYLGRNAS